MSLPLPVIGGGESSVVQELRVVAWVPEKYALVGDPQDFHLRTISHINAFLFGEQANRNTSSVDNWVLQGISVSTSAAQFPTEGRVPYVYTNLGGAKEIVVTWWNNVSMTLIFSIAVGLIGWILMRTSWENKLGMFLIGCFAATMYGLEDSHLLNQGLHAARYGFGFIDRSLGTAKPVCIEGLAECLIDQSPRNHPRDSH